MARNLISHHPAIRLTVEPLVPALPPSTPPSPQYMSLPLGTECGALEVSIVGSDGTRIRGVGGYSCIGIFTTDELILAISPECGGK